MTAVKEVRETVHVFVTPKELRELADKADNKLKSATLGESLLFHVIDSTRFEVRFSVAQ